MAALAWMLDTNTLSALIENPRGALVERLACAFDPVTHNLREFQRVPALRGSRTGSALPPDRPSDSILRTLCAFAHDFVYPDNG